MSEFGNEEKSVAGGNAEQFARDSRVNFEDGELQVRIGSSGIGEATMQMNRVSSLDADVAGLAIRIGSSGVGNAMMQMNRVESVTLNVAGLEVGIGDEKGSIAEG
jgi:hypothetical protein